MAAKKPARKTPAPAQDATDAVIVSATGAELIDGQPYFAMLNGVKVNRRQYIDQTRPARKDALVAALREETEKIAAEAHAEAGDAGT